MIEATCVRCGGPMPPAGTRGPSRRYCSGKCRESAHRTRRRGGEPRQPPISRVTSPDFVLYRFFDAERRLLYVGQTIQWLQRIRQHQRKKQWRDQIATITLQRFDSWEALDEAERQAIKTEDPLHNVTHKERRFCGV